MTAPTPIGHAVSTGAEDRLRGLLAGGVRDLPAANLQGAVARCLRGEMR